MDRTYSRLIFLGLLFLVLISNAEAVRLIVSDQNGSPQAAPGEDVNVLWHGTRDINSDTNYLVRLFYRGTFWDVNVWDVNKDILYDVNNDVNADQFNRAITSEDKNFRITQVSTVNINAGSGCPGAGGWYKVFSPNDLNMFDVNFKVPSTVPKGIIVEVQLWDINTGPPVGNPAISQANCRSGTAAHKGSLIITPAIFTSTMLGQVDQNVTVLGFGFKRSMDQNVVIQFRDSNGSNTDLNISDVNYRDVNAILGSNPMLGVPGDLNFWFWKKTAVNDDNVSTDLNRPIFDQSNPDGNYEGWHIYVDANGEFDVNIRVPATFTMPSAPGTMPDTNIVARDYRSPTTFNGDANRTFIIMPGITLQTDLNITVRVCDGNRTCTQSQSGDYNTFVYSIDYAMQNNLISNTSAVKGIIVRMCDGTCGANTPLIMQAVMLNDLNLSKAPSRNYSGNMNADQGGGNRKSAGIDTTQMPEFKIDANITFFNVKSASSEMPTLLRDGKRCGSMCSSYIWAYNSTAGDGNITFRVSTFSTYVTTLVDMNVTAPNGGEKIRDSNGIGQKDNASIPRDQNYRITFSFRDTNQLDWNQYNNNHPLDVNIFLSRDGNGTGRYRIYGDNNLWDDQGVVCSPTFAADNNLMTTRSCGYDWNMHADFNSQRVFREHLVNNIRIAPYGSWYMDINISDWNGGFVLDSSDANFFLNPPRVKIWDTNMATSHFYWNSAVGQTFRDTNITIDFNVFVPDGNSLNDMNMWVYYTTANTSRGTKVINTDLNLSDFNRQNVAPFRCSDNNKTLSDSNCRIDLSLAAIAEGNYYLFFEVRDKNGLIDSNYSTLSFTINDVGNPTCGISSPADNITSTSRDVNVIYSCSDTTSGSGIENYWYAVDGGAFTNNGTSLNHVFSSLSDGQRSLKIKAKDYAGNYSGVVSRTINISLSGGGSGSGSSGGGTTGGTTPPTTETILTQTMSEQPSSETVATVLADGGYSAEEIAAIPAATKTDTERTVEVLKNTSTSNVVTYSSNISVNVSNNTEKDLTDVKVVEIIPKSVAETASDITVEGYNYRVLKDDPIIEITIPEIKVGESVTVVYTVAKKLASADLSDWSAPIVANFSEVLPTPTPEEEPEQGTTPSEPGQGYTPTTTSTGAAAGEPTQPPQDVLPIVLVALVVVLAIGYFFFFKKEDGKSLTYKK